MTSALKKTKPAAPTHYATLGVPPSASQEEIAVQFRKLSRTTHPDAGGDPVRQAEINLAYGVLKNIAFRSQYDAQLKLGGRQCLTCHGRGTLPKNVSFTKTKEVLCVICRGTGQQP